MPRGLLRSVAWIFVAMLTLVATSAVVPTRVRFGSSSFTCGTVFDRQSMDPIAAGFCELAVTYRFRATVAITVLVVVLACLPMALERIRPSLASRHVLWLGTVLLVVVGTVAVLAAVGARAERVVVDL